VAANVTFAIGGDSIEIPGPTFSRQGTAGPSRYVTAVTPNGTRYSYKVGSSSLHSWRLDFDLDAANFAALEEFYNDVAEGPTNEVTFTDTSGEQHTVRFIDSALQASRLGPNQWFVSLNLEVSQSIVESAGSGS